MRIPLPAAFLRVPLAHRAYHDRNQRRPENSPGAVKAAIVAGYGIEIDLQLSSDGVAMVFHDEALERAIELFSKVFEPILMLVVGGLIGLIVFMLYMPIFELAGSIQG